MTTENLMTGKDSFIRGWNYGKKQNKELTAREIVVQFPDVRSDEFAQGNIDGMNQDRFRLDLILYPNRIA